MLFSSEQVAARSDCRRLGNSCVYAPPCNGPSCARAWPQELGHWFCSQNLRLSSRIAFGSDCQMSCSGSSLNTNLNSAPDQQVLEVLSAPKSQNQVCGVWILFKTLNLRTVESRYQPSSIILETLWTSVTSHEKNSRLTGRAHSDSSCQRLRQFFFNVSRVPEQCTGVFKVTN